MNEVVIGVACEDNGHFRAVSCLIDRRCVTEHSWLEGVLNDCRRWCGDNANNQWLNISHLVRKDVRPTKIGGVTIKRHGHINGEPLKQEASMWRDVLRQFLELEKRPDVVVLVRDSDGRDQRAGIIQVREGLPWPFSVVMAVPHPEVEAWYVSGFVPESNQEKRQLSTLAKELSFDPISQSHRLTSHPNSAPHDAKRILSALCGNDEERRQRCLVDEPRLRERGAKNGLTEFLEEVDGKVVPLFGKRA